MSNLISLNQIKRHYDVGGELVKALDGVDVSIESNDYISIMGPSGSGKSTLLNLISLIDKPSTGSIKLDNIKINDDDNDQRDMIRSKKIGIIYQDKNLLADFTTLENVYLARLSLSDN